MRYATIDLSRAVGYEDISFFRTLFKRHTGAPPRVYRSRSGPARSRWAQPAIFGRLPRRQTAPGTAIALTQ